MGITLWRIRRTAHGALSLVGQLKIAVAGATNVHAGGGVRLGAEKTRICHWLAGCGVELAAWVVHHSVCKAYHNLQTSLAEACAKYTTSKNVKIYKLVWLRYVQMYQL